MGSLVSQTSDPVRVPVESDNETDGESFATTPRLTDPADLDSLLPPPETTETMNRLFQLEQRMGGPLPPAVARAWWVPLSLV